MVENTQLHNVSNLTILLGDSLALTVLLHKWCDFHHKQKQLLTYIWFPFNISTMPVVHAALENTRESGGKTWKPS
jgi:hypothetical protein